MIRIEALQLRRLAADVLKQLDVVGTVEVMEVRELTDGTWMAGFADRLPGTRFPGFEIGIQQDWSPEQAVRELRLELREKLWICPLCQRRAQIRRIIDREVFRVECVTCGRFEIEHDLLRYFREVYEAGDPGFVEQLQRLSELVGRMDGMPSFTADNWRDLADIAAR